MEEIYQCKQLFLNFYFGMAFVFCLHSNVQVFYYEVIFNKCMCNF